MDVLFEYEDNADMNKRTVLGEREKKRIVVSSCGWEAIYHVLEFKYLLFVKDELGIDGVEYCKKGMCERKS